MAEEKYDTRYTKAEKNVMWTIAFVILLLVMVFWGLWYFNRPAATTAETGIAADEAAPAATEAPVGTESSGTAGTAASGEAMPETTSPTTTTTGQTY